MNKTSTLQRTWHANTANPTVSLGDPPPRSGSVTVASISGTYTCRRAGEEKKNEAGAVVALTKKWYPARTPVWVWGETQMIKNEAEKVAT